MRDAQVFRKPFQGPAVSGTNVGKLAAATGILIYNVSMSIYIYFFNHYNNYLLVFLKESRKNFNIPFLLITTFSIFNKYTLFICEIPRVSVYRVWHCQQNWPTVLNHTSYQSMPVYDAIQSLAHST